MTPKTHSDITERILKAALVVFGRSGPAGATMRAVAKEAGVSRPTVYARYANKDALFRATMSYVFQAALADVVGVVERGGPLSEVLAGVLESYFGRLYDEALALEHLAEIIEEQRRLAPDIVEDTDREMRGHLMRALSAQRCENSPEDSERIDRDELVELLMIAPRGFKQQGTTSEMYRHHLYTLAKVVARAAS